MKFEEKDLPPVTREELHVQAEEEMVKPGPGGDAWLYIFTLTGPANAEKSKAWVQTMLNRAANDEQIHPIRRQIYFDASVSLD